MHFCTNCNNMYYIQLSEDNENQIIYYCRKCGNKNTDIALDSVCISKTNIKHGKQKYNTIINKYTSLDPTLPRINTIKCPNQSCDSNKEFAGEKGDKNEREIIYLRYDDINMNFVYMCASCKTLWSTEQVGSS
jgi:DNA-directed RNA polymerase subunit M/transcription elongation factor TFIIS